MRGLDSLAIEKDYEGLFKPEAWNQSAAILSTRGILNLKWQKLIVQETLYLHSRCENLRV